MRLDKFLSITGRATRSETGAAVRKGEVLVDGIPARAANQPVDPDTASVLFRGDPVVYRPFTYLLMNKPDGVISATEDRRGGEQTVLDLLPAGLLRLRPALFPCGRLDKHTTGLMLITNNGPLSHRLLSPARHVDKTYRFRVKFPLSDEDETALEAGVDIGGYRTAPCFVERDGETEETTGAFVCRSGRITLREGKYHQIKRMMEVRHNQITELERISFGPLTLDETLPRGAWRYLTDGEIRELEASGGQTE